jgi:hypothetical protein
MPDIAPQDGSALLSQTPPVTLDYARLDELPPRRLWRVIFVPPMCMLLAWSIGAATNAVSGAVSRTYFDVMVGSMYGGAMTLGDVIWQGLLESTQARASLKMVVHALALAAVAAVVGWLLGALVGVGLCLWSPVDFHNSFPPSRTVDGAALLRWGFVGGSIWGVYGGGFAAIIVASITLATRWRGVVERSTQEADARDGQFVSARSTNS